MATSLDRELGACYGGDLLRENGACRGLPVTGIAALADLMSALRAELSSVNETP